MSEPAADRPSKDLATVGDLRRASAASQALAAAKRLKNYIWGTTAIVVATVVITMSVTAWAQSKVDAGVSSGVAPVTERVSKNEKRIEKTEEAVIVLDKKVARIEVMVEMLLDNRGITPPPKVMPDGGP